MSCSRRRLLSYVCEQSSLYSHYLYIFGKPNRCASRGRFALFNPTRRTWRRQIKNAKHVNFVFAVKHFTPQLFSTFLQPLCMVGTWGRDKVRLSDVVKFILPSYSLVCLCILLLACVSYTLREAGITVRIFSLITHSFMRECVIGLQIS